MPSSSQSAAPGAASTSASTSSSSGRFTRAIPFSRSIVKSILSKATLSLPSLILHPTSPASESAGGSRSNNDVVRLTLQIALGGGVLGGSSPSSKGLPLNAKVYLPEAQLAVSARGAGGDEAQLISLGSLSLQPFHLDGSDSKNNSKGASAPGEIQTEAELRFSSAAEREAFAQLVRRVLVARSAGGDVKVQVISRTVKIKAYGMTFADLKLHKEIALDGFDGLGGILSFDSAGSASSTDTKQGHASNASAPAPPPVLLSVPSTGSMASSASQEDSKSSVQGKSKKKNRLSKLFSRSSSSSAKKSSESAGDKLLPPTPAPASPSGSTSDQTTVIDHNRPHKGAAKDSTGRISISNLDIVGGDAERGMLIEADALVVNNSSSLTADVGDLRFALAAELASRPSSSEGPAIIGDIVLRAVKLVAGQSTYVRVQGCLRIPQGPENAAAAEAATVLVGKILQNEPVDVVALALSSNAVSPVSDVGWLARAFDGARIRARIPALGEKVRLLKQVKLTSKYPPAATTTEEAQHQAFGPGAVLAETQLSNNFGAQVHIHSLDVLAVTEDEELHSAAARMPHLSQSRSAKETLALGKIELGQEGSGWEGVQLASGKETPASLPIALNEDRAVLIEVLRRAARKQGVLLGMDLEQVLDLIPGSHGGTQVGTPTESDEKALSASSTDGRVRLSRTHSSPHLLRQATSGQVSDLPTLLVRSLANLHVTAHILARVQIGSYVLPAPIRFSQGNLSVGFTQQVATAILPEIGQPIVARLLEQAELLIEGVDVKQLHQDHIVADLTLRLSNYGPLLADVTFPGGLHLGRVSDGEKLVEIFFEDGHLVLDPKEDKAVVVKATIRPCGSNPQASLSSFVSTILNEAESHWRVTASPMLVKAIGVTFTSSLDKTTTIAGLNSLQGIALSNFDITGEKEGQLLIDVEAEVMNPAALSLSLSKMTLSLHSDGVAIGVATATDIHLQAGSALRTKITGFIAKPENVTTADFQRGFSAVAGSLLAGQPAQLIIQGVSAQAAGAESSLPWVDESLRSLKVPVTLEQPALDLIKSVDVGNLDVQFSSKHDPVIKVLQASATYQIPYPITVELESASAHAEIWFDDHLVGEADIEDSQITEESSHGEAGLPQTRTLKLDLQSFRLVLSDEAVMSDLIEHAFQCKTTDRVGLRGRATASARTAAGPLKVELDLAGRHKIQLQGLNGLRDSPLGYQNLQVIDADPQKLDVRFDLSLSNPSHSLKVSLQDTDLSFAGYFAGAYVGRAYVAKGHFDFPTGNILMKDVRFDYEPSQNEHLNVRKLPANFLSGEVSTLEIRGDDKTCDIPVLRKAFKSLAMRFDLQALINKTLIDNITITLGLSMLTASSVECSFIVNNPLGAVFELRALSFVARYKGQPFGSSSVNFRQSGRKPLLVKTGSPKNPGQETGYCTVKLAQSLDKLVKTFIQARGRVDLDVQLQAEVEIQGFAIPLFEYTQHRLPLLINGLEGVQKLLWVLP